MDGLSISRFKERSCGICRSFAFRLDANEDDAATRLASCAGLEVRVVTTSEPISGSCNVSSPREQLSVAVLAISDVKDADN